MTTVDRSLLLCQLINDRQIDKEVGPEIRKLLIEGVDINIQDLNRHNNTPLHLATQKSDKKCIQLLLKYKPDLEIRNGNGETPLDVAQNDEIRELLSSASFDVVEKKFVREIEFQDLYLDRLKCLETDATYKVLKITCSPNVQIVWEKLNQDDIITSINNSSHLFIIAIETKEDDIKGLLEPSVDIKRPIVVQVTSTVTKKFLIYYKDENSKQLIEVSFHSPIGKKDFLEKIHSKADCNFSLLVHALNSNIFGTFSGSLLDVKLNNDENRSRLKNYFARSDALCHRFFKLLDEKLTKEELKARATSALLFPGDQSLLALLDLPFEFIKDEVELTEDQRRILYFVDPRNYNLIMLAIECKNTDAVKALLRFPIDLNHLASDKRWASDLCWVNQNWECLAELIEASSPYPDNFNASYATFAASSALDKIKTNMAAATAFHECIQCRDIEMIKTFIKNNPNLKHVYDRSNKSALTLALEYDDAEIYSLLLSERFTPGVDDEYDEALKNCNVKDEIRNTNREYFRNAFNEPHLKRLLKQYKLSFTSANREACSKVIQNMFLTLNEIPEMVPILRIVSCSEKLNIVFDFDCHSVKEMDPTKGSSTKGLVYPIDGFIYIGAGNHREGFYEVIGTLAHELTHYAMQLTYGNSCKPYAIGDKANQEMFKSIVDETRKLVEVDPLTDSIIRTVFTCYDQEVWHQELIVRAPHLLTNYKDAAETFEEARHKNYRMFDFFLSKVLPDVKAQTKVSTHKLEIRKINSLTGTLEKIENHEIQLKKCEIKIEDQIIGSNAPQLTLGMLHQSLDDSSHVFISIEQIAFGNIRERIGKVEKIDFAIVVDCTGMVQKHAETICNVRQIFSNSGKIFLVMKAEETSIVTTKLMNFRVTDAHHNWSDLTGESQEALLQKNVNFQGTSCILKDLTNKSSVALLDLPLNEFYDSENFKIGDPLANPFHKFYQPRNFITRISKEENKGDQLENDTATSAVLIQSNSKPQIEQRIFNSGPKDMEGLIESKPFETIEKTLNEILVESKSKTVVIISDSAGTGKTSTLHEIARNLSENYPTRWTVLVELKQYIQIFKKTQGDFKSFQDFFTQIILADKSIFEKNLFAQFYEEGRANILFDGFDEISPHYKKEVLKALTLFTPKSGNQLWITTRSHLELALEKTLDQLACSLQPLTRACQIEFLEKVWKSNTKSIQGNLRIAANYLIHKLSSICNSNSSFIGLPILISMVAEIFDDSEKRNSIQTENFSFYSIFKQFVDKNIDISIKKGEIAEMERTEILKQSEGIVEVHRKIAIAHFFGNEIADVDVEYDDEQWTVEKLTRFGLIRYDESKRSLSFIHETFAEYFLTDFIVGNLKTTTRARGAVKILVGVLTEKDFQVVRLFLDQSLKELNFSSDKKLCETVGQQLSSMKEESSRVLLHISKESCEEVFKFMLHAIERIQRVEERFRLINEKDEYGNDVLLINIRFNTKTMIKKLFDLMEKNVELKIAKEMFQGQNLRRENIYHRATLNKNEEILQTLYESMQPILTAVEIKKMLKAKDQDENGVLHYAPQCCNESAFNDLMKILRDLFSNEEVTAMFFEVNKQGDKSLHIAARYNNKITLKWFFKHINILNYDQTKDFIHQRGCGRRNIFHSACFNKNDEIFPTLHKCIINFLGKHEMKKILREKTERESNILHYAAALSNENALKDLMKILRDLFSDEEMKEMLFEVNENGNNSLHVANYGNNKITLKSFFQHINIFLNSVETKKLILQRGFLHRNIFQTACENKNEEIFSTIHECMQTILTTDEIKKMLREKNQNDWNILQSAAQFCNESTLNDLMKILKELFNNEDMKEMLFEVNRVGNNSFHVAARYKNKITLKSFFIHPNVFLNPEEMKELIQQKGFLRRSIFQTACENENEEIFSTLHECMQPIMTAEEIKNMLRAKNQNKWNVLHSAAAFCNENAMNDLMKLLRELFSNDEMKEMLLEVNKYGNNSLHTAARLSHKVALKSFFKLLNVFLNHEETRKLIQKRGFKQRNIFQSACHSKNEEIFSTLYECTKVFLDKHEIKKMHSEKDEFDRNLLQHCATVLCSESAKNDIMKVLEELFSDEEIKEMNNNYILDHSITMPLVCGAVVIGLSWALPRFIRS